MYDCLLGGKDNYAADRAAAQAWLKVNPDLVPSAYANRAFLGRAIRYLAAEAGVRQFLDIGTGIPTAGNTHHVAQAIAPEFRGRPPASPTPPPKASTASPNSRPAAPTASATPPTSAAPSASPAHAAPDDR
jgi:hypothetical protein